MVGDGLFDGYKILPATYLRYEIYTEIKIIGKAYKYNHIAFECSKGERVFVRSILLKNGKISFNV